MTPLEGALEMVARGFFVHPLHPGTKRPILKDWEVRASGEPSQLHAWASQFSNCNFGIALGRSGHFALDLDRKGGRDGVASLEALLLELAP